MDYRQHQQYQQYPNQMKLIFMLLATILIIPTASAELLFDGTFNQNDHFDTGSFGAFGASRIDHSIITVIPANSLGRGGYMTKWHMTADGDYTEYQNPIEPDNPVQYQLLFTDGTPLYISVGQEIWYGWSQYLNPSWKTSENSWEAVGMSLDAWNVGGYGLQFFSGTTDNYFVMNGKAPTVPAFNMQTGEWYDIVYHIKWSYDSSGFVEVYLKDQYQTNYSLIYSISNVQTRMQNEHDNIDMTLGISRSAKNTKDQIVYFMDPKIGTSMEDVVFGSPSSPYPPIVPPTTPAILPGMFDILNEKYITDISELPESTNLQPEMSWSPSYDWVHDHCKRDYSPKFVFGWLDIVGFKNGAKLGDQLYINESPDIAAIIRYETYACVLGHRLFKGPWIYKLETYQQDNQFVAKLTATKILYSIVGETYYYDNETRIFYDYEPMPLQYNQPMSGHLNIIEYNNTVNPRTVLDLSAENLTYIDYVYKNEQIQNYRKTARVEQTVKGIYFANLTTVNIWTAGTPTLHQMNDQVIIQKTASPDYSFLKVTVSNLYETKLITNYSIVRDTYTIERTFNSLFYTILFTSLILLAMIILIGKGIIK